MTINAQSECGEIKIFDDFFNGVTNSGIADSTTTPDSYAIGPFHLCGNGINEVDSGMITQNILSGVGRLTTTNEDNHCAALTLGGNCLDVALMAPIVLEARVQMDTLCTREAFFGLSDIATDTVSIESSIMHGTATTLTLTASDICGFHMSSELTDSSDWHAVYNGGSTTGETTSSNVDLDEDMTAGEFQVLRLEVDPNGTARWYVDGSLKKTLEGAVSTTTDMNVTLAVESKTTSNIYMDVDYLLVKAHRDWNA